MSSTLGVVLLSCLESERPHESSENGVPRPVPLFSTAGTRLVKCQTTARNANVAYPEMGVGNGYRLYDFGTGRPDVEYGVRDFKAKFGGELVCYGRNTCVHAPRLLWLSERGYRLVRRWL